MLNDITLILSKFLFSWQYHQKNHGCSGRRRDSIIGKWEETSNSSTVVPVHSSIISSVCRHVYLDYHISLHAWGILFLVFYLGGWLINFLWISKLISKIGITHGNESKVGYYVGLLVRCLTLCKSSWLIIIIHSNHYFSLPRFSLCYIGVVYLTVSAGNPLC